MTLPCGQTEISRSILIFLQDGRDHTIRETYQYVDKIHNQENIEKGNFTKTKVKRFESSVRAIVSNLRKTKMLKNTKNGVFHITERGLDELLNFHKISNISENFRDECYKLITNTSLDSMNKSSMFLELAIKTTTKFPFAFLPELIEDLIDKNSISNIIKKHNLETYQKFEAVFSSMLALAHSKANETKTQDIKINFKSFRWNKSHNWLKIESNRFFNPFLAQFNYNILRAVIIITIFKHEYISNEDNLEDMVYKTYEEIKCKLDVFSNSVKIKSFEMYINSKLKFSCGSILDELQLDYGIVNIDGNISIPVKYTNINKEIQDVIQNENEGISYRGLVHKLKKILPLYTLIPEIGIFKDILNELEKKKLILRKRSLAKFDSDNDQLFLYDNYMAKMEKIKNNLMSSGRTKFFGRVINPEQFINEIKTMNVGDLEDADDQVTRIAGLVLRDSILLRNSREHIPNFDFVIDMSNYDRIMVQKEFFSKIGFKVRSNILHCKVLINETITTDTLTNLQSNTPNDEQGIIFTCMPVSDKVRQIIKDDKSVQIIDQDGIYKWCLLAPVIPSRRYSVVRVMYGDHIGRIARVISLNYESGLATIESVPDYKEIIVSIGSISEILPNVHDELRFGELSKKYFEFLCLVAKLSSEHFESGMDTKVLNFHESFRELKKSTNPELFVGQHPKFMIDEQEHQNHKYIEFENVYVKLFMRGSDFTQYLQCSCSHTLNEEYNKTLCVHQIATINYLCVTKDVHAMNKQIVLLESRLKNFQIENIFKMIETIHDLLGVDNKRLILDYVRECLKSKLNC